MNSSHKNAQLPIWHSNFLLKEFAKVLVKLIVSTEMNKTIPLYFLNDTICF